MEAAAQGRRAGAGHEDLGRFRVHEEIARAARPRAPDRHGALRISDRRASRCGQRRLRAVHGAVGRNPRPAQRDSLSAGGLEARRDPGCGAAPGRPASAGQVVYRSATRARFDTGRTSPKSELGARYATADLLVFPTLGDGFGLVIQEAMCSGNAGRHHPCGGGPECITDGVDGWIVPPRDIDALVERLRACAADRDRLHAVGRAARARAERWTWRDAGQALVSALWSSDDARPLPQPVFARGQRARREPADAAGRADSSRASRRTSSCLPRGLRFRAMKRWARGSTSRRWRCCGAISPLPPPLIRRGSPAAPSPSAALAKRIERRPHPHQYGGLAGRGAGGPRVGSAARPPLSRQHDRSAEVGVRSAGRDLDPRLGSNLLHFGRDGRDLPPPRSR